VTQVEILPVGGLGEIAAGDDLASLIAGAFEFADGDVAVVSSKIVSKALGLHVAATSRDASIAAASVRVVAARQTPRGLAQIVQAQAGPVMAAAGVDNSNVRAGTVLLLPADPDGVARALLARLGEVTGATIGLVISDTAGRAWRNGQTDFALGAAGLMVTDDLRGTRDTHGQPMEVTVRAVADEIAAAADLVKGKLSAVPVAVIRGLGSAVIPEDGPGAASMLRAADDDWFRLGHVEAVRSSLGAGLGDVAPPAVPPSPVPERLGRVLDVAVTGGIPGWARASFSVTQTGSSAEARSRDPLALGALAQRIAAAAWSEDLAVQLSVSPGPSWCLCITATAAPGPSLPSRAPARRQR
jgi:coenzyme F420-0:L-glutamate ligase/coenzyme F420-1:gamma-L-glutamate ligase